MIHTWNEECRNLEICTPPLLHSRTREAALAKLKTKPHQNIGFQHFSESRKDNCPCCSLCPQKICHNRKFRLFFALLLTVLLQ